MKTLILSIYPENLSNLLAATSLIRGSEVFYIETYHSHDLGYRVRLRIRSPQWTIFSEGDMLLLSLYGLVLDAP